MTPLGPFEKAPRLAVAVSGGADSMALCLLSHAWARRRRGRVVALTVDHGLRPESGREARQVGRWLAALGIEHHVLRWRGEKRRSGIQAAAREARYRLLGGWCRRHRLLHLLLAHHLEDQAETFFLRLGRGSGVEGLAAMAPASEAGGVRLLRPLLGTAKGRLVDLLRTRRQSWIEDPSNLDPAFARTRARQSLEDLGREGITAARLAATARRMGRARTALEAAVTDLLAGSTAIDAAGFCLLDAGAFAAAPEEVGLRALARVLMCVGGAPYAPRLERLQRLYAALVTDGLTKGRTLGGCRIGPWREHVLVCREAAAAAPAMPIDPGARYRWDGRFAVRLGRLPSGRKGRLHVGRLGREGWAQAAARRPSLRATPIPAPARPSLPTLWDIDGVVVVPHLHYCRDGERTPTSTPAHGRTAFVAEFRPACPLSPPGFVLA